jgi:hypothetical protein
MIKKTLITIALLLFSTAAFAQHYEDHGTHHKKHHVALFDGATTNFGHSTTGYSIGLDYEYLMSDVVGAGLIAEYVFSGTGELIVGVPVFYHPTNNLKIGAGPIGVFVEKHHDTLHNDGHDTVSNNVEKEWEVGARFNVTYSLHFGSISAGPSVSMDVANTTSLAYGLSFGIGL